MTVQDFDDTAEAFLALLLAHRATNVFINPGTDTFPIQEAWARRRERGLPTPRPIMCLHEHTAVSAAHGYYLASHQPQAVVVHVDAGTLNAGGALHNAQRGGAGMLFCAGRAPMTMEGEMQGGKDLPIHFWQDQLDQAGIVRNFVKWHYELTRTENISAVIERAFQLTSNPPVGPVYLTMTREVLMLPARGVRMPEPRRMTPPTVAAADPRAIEQAARILTTARQPLVVAGRSGRDEASVPVLARIAEHLGARIVDPHDYVSVPGNHVLNVGPALGKELAKSDAILFVEPDVPYVPNVMRPSPDASVIQISADPLHQDYVFWNFPVDLQITANPASAINALLEAIQDAQTSEQRARAVQRCEDVAAERRGIQEQAQARMAARSTVQPMDGEYVAWVLGQVLPAEAILLDDTITNKPWIRTHLRRNTPGTFFSPGGSSLGWPPNAAMGVKLARPDSTVVALVGDGGFTFANPVAALWSAQNANAPFMTVIFNNAGYDASKMPIIREMYPGGAVARANDGIVTAISPSPDYALIAQGCGAFGVTVHDPLELRPALERGLDEVRHGRNAVVNAVLRPI